MKMFITFEPNGIFGSDFVHLCILTLSSHWYAKCDEASPNIILTGQALLVKMLITLESNRTAMNRNWSDQKANPALKTKTGTK